MYAQAGAAEGAPQRVAAFLAGVRAAMDGGSP